MQVDAWGRFFTKIACVEVKIHDNFNVNNLSLSQINLLTVDIDFITPKIFLDTV